MLKLFRKIPFIAVFWIFFYFFIFCLLLRSGFSYLDPDLGWHLQVGGEISKTWQVPSQNIYNYTYTGTWVDHEWLSNYLIFQIYNNLGYPALVASFALLIVIVLILLNMAVIYLWRQQGKEPPLILIVLFQILGVLAAMPHFGVRIQEIALLFLFLILALIYFYNKNKNWRYLLLYIPIFYLWSCLHASFLIGLFIVFAWAGIKLLERIILNLNFKNKSVQQLDLSGVISYHEILIYILFSAAAFIATLFTPYYLKLYSFLFGYSNILYLSYIQEWFSQFSYPFFYWQLFYLCLAALALLIYFYSASKKKINLWTAFIFLLFFILSFKSRRHFPLFFVSTFIFLLDIYGNYIKGGAAGIKKLPIWLKIYLLVCVFLSGLSILLMLNYISNPFSPESFKKDYPGQALIFINSHLEYNNSRIFNDYGWGGYLIFSNPEKQIFIDGRLPQVLYKGHSFLEEYLDFYRSDSEIKQKLTEYNIGLVLLQVKDKKSEAKAWEKFLFYLKNEDLNPPNNLRQYLNSSRDWQLVYSDEAAVIYKRIK